jgi:hypothetical protein
MACGAPISVLIASAISSRRLSYTSRIRPRSASLSETLQLLKPGKAARAAAIAFSASAEVPSGTLATLCSVAGLITSISAAPREGATHSPLM